MAKQPDIFIKNEIVFEARHPTLGNGDWFKSQIGALIDHGYVVAVGETSIEQEFDSSAEFNEWFDHIAS